MSQGDTLSAHIVALKALCGLKTFLPLTFSTNPHAIVLSSLSNCRDLSFYSIKILEGQSGAQMNFETCFSCCNHPSFSNWPLVDPFKMILLMEDKIHSQILLKIDANMKLEL